MKTKNITLTTILFSLSWFAFSPPAQAVLRHRMETMETATRLRVAMRSLA
jgi:hypothetical protein